MAKIKSFEDMVCWQKSKSLSLEVYTCFKNCKDFAFKNQIERAALSIMNNLAEGFERQSNKEFRQFLYIAKGSSGEVRSMLFIAKDLGYISSDNFDKLYLSSLEISKTISGLIKTL